MLVHLSQQDLALYTISLILAIFVTLLTRRLLRISFPYFFMGILGLVVGLWVGSRLGAPFAGLPAPYNRWIPMSINVVIAAAILDLFLAQARSIGSVFGRLGHLINHWLSRLSEIDTRPKSEILVDTSVLVDGRIEEIARTGFVMAKLVVPKFVLAELQLIADSSDPLKRMRGRKGLDTLAILQKVRAVAVEISEDNGGRNDGVDAKLVRLAKQRPAKVLTVDYNLNRVAQIQGVEVLNINELATALRPQLLPGEKLFVQVIQKGKERGQGLGYLPDGTMLVVEGGSAMVGQTVECEVVRIFQSVTGKMIFVEPVKLSKKERS